jgi:hypothetical protein
MDPVEAVVSVGFAAYVAATAAAYTASKIRKGTAARGWWYASTVILLAVACGVTVFNATMQQGEMGLVMFTVMAAVSALMVGLSGATAKLWVLWVAFAVLLATIAITIPLTLVWSWHIPPPIKI